VLRTVLGKSKERVKALLVLPILYSIREDRVPYKDKQRYLAYQGWYREEYREEVNKKAREYGHNHRDERSANTRRWRQNNKDRRRELDRKYYSEHREKRLVKSKVQQALKTGKIVKPERCQSCNAKKPLCAHHKDYSKPLEVVWLCRACHGLSSRRY
jgi:hypothetical protein